ncbi:hypothetical protein AB0M29_03975 [Streptomyces sp. NPDC051976]|uniref:hypothetical protein n=1 Tax=Streptomyces sp. NPDC051976 TaxID=3154947 RepID=UPI003430C8D5
MARRRTELVKATADTTELTPFSEAFGEVELVADPGLPAASDTLEAHPEEILAEPPDARDISAELAAPPRRKLPWLTLLLSAGVVAAAAFAGGALVEKNHLQSSPTASRGTFGGGTGGGTRTGATGGTGTARTGGTGLPGATGGAGGTGGNGGSGVTIGTIKLVDGNTIYVTDAQGNIVKVTTGGSTKVTESKSGKVSDLQPGQSVTVRGSQNSSGDVAATTVTEGGLTGGGFGGFGGFGGNRGGGTGAAGGTGGSNSGS